MRTLPGALTALAAIAAGTAVAAPAGAAPASPRPPAFLSPGELPPHPTSSWTAGEVTDGVPEELRLCLDEQLPAHGHRYSRYREFRTDLDTGARQLTVVLRSAAAARTLAARLNDAIRSCPQRIERTYPEATAEHADYGPLPVEEGARVHGLHTVTEWGATDIHLLSVGRDGRTVTVVEWAQLGDFDDAPVAAFRTTTTTAVAKLR